MDDGTMTDGRSGDPTSQPSVIVPSAMLFSIKPTPRREAGSKRRPRRNPMHPFLLSESNYGQVKERPFEVAVLPLGATEPHNLHLPYGTDTYQVEAVGRLACAMAHDRGARVALLPA